MTGSQRSLRVRFDRMSDGQPRVLGKSGTGFAARLRPCPARRPLFTAYEMPSPELGDMNPPASPASRTRPAPGTMSSVSGGTGPQPPRGTRSRRGQASRRGESRASGPASPTGAWSSGSTRSRRSRRHPWERCTSTRTRRRCRACRCSRSTARSGPRCDTKSCRVTYVAVFATPSERRTCERPPSAPMRLSHVTAMSSRRSSG